MSEAQISTAVATDANGDAQGTRMRRTFMPRLLADQDWINKNVVAKGKGFKVQVGRLFGGCYKSERKENTLPNGDKSESIVLTGVFEITNTITGEVSNASQAFLPMAFSEQVEAAFKLGTGVEMVEVDIDIGLEATGKTIPYEWMIVSHLEGAQTLFLNRLRQRRVAGNRLPSPSAQAALTAPEPVSAGPVIDGSVEKEVATKKRA